MPEHNEHTPEGRLKKRYIVSVIVIVGLLAGGIFIAYTLQAAAHATGKTDQLSQRAKEFIAKDTADGEGMWSVTNFNKNPDVITSDNPASSVSTPCFSLTVPVASTNYSQEQEGLRCTFHAKMLDPLSQLVISSYPSKNPDEDSGIQLRLKNTDQYLQLPFAPKDFEKAWLFKGDDHMTAFVWKSSRMSTLSITGVLNAEHLDPKVFEKMLSSMTLHYDVALPSPTPQSTNSATIKKL